MKTRYSKIIYVVVGLLIINIISFSFFKRFDLTEDGRYTLSETTKEIVENVDDVILIKVYLEGDFPAEFKRLQTETKLHLEELKAINKNIKFRFVDPSSMVAELIESGIEPSNLQVQENGKMSELVIFPWASIKYKNKVENVSLLKDIFTNSQDQQLESSIQNLEYAFANATHKLSSKKEQKIAILKGNGELDDIYIADFLRKVNEYYRLAPFTLDSVAKNPQKTLKELKQFDLIIIPKPTEKFSEAEKYTLDQYSMNGGKSLWLIDNVHAELDSLMQTGASLAYPRDLGLTDFLFNYGVRVNFDLITDLYSSKIPLATGNVGNQTQFDSFLWEYFPLVNSRNNHAINNNIEAVSLKFTNSIDTLKNGIRKTVLLQSSPLSKTVGTPEIISLKTIAEQKDPAAYNNGNKPLAVLLEGEFKSAYTGRVKPFTILNSKDKSTATKMIVISDGDIIANEISKGQPLELGVDRWSNMRFGNKEFLLNTVNYLLDDNELIHIRSKTIQIDFLDKQKAFEQASKWQFINIVIPLLILAIFGITFNYFKKKKYQ